MKVWVKGQGTTPITLTRSNYVGGGGEGNVYEKNGTAYKIYHDPARMLALGKIQELAAIQDPRVVKPLNVLLDEHNKPIGYTTKFVPNAYTLCQTFTKDFRDRTGLDHKKVGDLVRKLREGVQNVHGAQVLIVDLNEMNFLVDHGFADVFFIDVDSYQTRGFPATAIMPSIRDWTVTPPNFTENSDWFSFGIVSYQMFTGIHPYKGKHPTVKGLEERMKAGISVFDPQVHVPAAAYPMTVIPAVYRAWYEAIFKKGDRVPPPLDFTAAVILVPVAKTVTGTNLLDIVEIGQFDGHIQGFWSDGVRLVVQTDKTIYLDKQIVGPAPKNPVIGCAFTPKACRAVLVEDATPLKLTNLTDRADVPFMLSTKQAVTHEGLIYARTPERIQEVLLTDAGSQVVASTKEAVQTLEHATKLFPGVVLQNFLGAIHASLLLSSGTAMQIRVKELDGYRILDAKFAGGVLMVVGEKKGVYDRFVFRSGGMGNYDTRVVKDIQPTGLNFVVLDTGVCVCMNEDEKLELFAARMGSTALKTVDDPMLSGDMKLGKMGGQVVFARGDKLYKLRMK